MSVDDIVIIINIAWLPGSCKNNFKVEISNIFNGIIWLVQFTIFISYMN